MRRYWELGASRWFLGVALGLALCVGQAAAEESAAPGQGGGLGARGYAGLASAAEGFAEVRPGRVFRFPADHGQHPNYRIEWWYITANLQDDAGADFGVQWTLFRQALVPQDGPVKEDSAFGGASSEKRTQSWRDRQVWLAHIAATSAASHHFEERMARGGVGQAGVRLTPFEAWLDDWSLEAKGEAAERLRLKAQGDGFGYELDLRAEGPLILQGEGGYHVKAGAGTGEEQASYYYSQPFFRVSGRLRIDGKERRVRGRAWMDREWSSKPLAPEQIGWDWFSLHFKTGEKMMIYRLRRSDGAPPDLAGTWIDANGRATTLGRDALRVAPLTPSSGGRAPTRWRLEAPSKGFSVTATALNPSAHQDSIFPYWEGPVRFDGTHQGSGFLELTGYKK